MQIKKTYQGVNPGLLYDELRDFILKRGAILGGSKLETYMLQDNSSAFVTRGTLTFRIRGNGAEKECIIAHVLGSDAETKILLDIDEGLFPPEKIAALQSDMDFIFGSREVKSKAD